MSEVLPFVGKIIKLRETDYVNAESKREITILLKRLRDVISHIKRTIEHVDDSDLTELRTEVAELNNLVGALIDKVTIEILQREKRE